MMFTTKSACIRYLKKKKLKLLSAFSEKPLFIYAVCVLSSFPLPFFLYIVCITLNCLRSIPFPVLPFPKQALVFTCLQFKSFENTVRKGENAPFFHCVFYSF